MWDFPGLVSSGHLGDSCRSFRFGVMGCMTGSLVVSVSGTSAATLDATMKLAAECDDRSVPLSLLISPKRQAGEPAVLDWLRGRTTGPGATDTLALHSMSGPTRRPITGLYTREFAMLPAHEAGLKLLAARTMLHHLGLPTETFAPPGWVASPGTVSALRRNGFRLCAELRGVRDLIGGVWFAGRVLGFGPGRRAEHWWSAAMVLGAGRSARRGGLVRLAVDAADLARPGVATAVRDAVDIALHHGVTPLTYADLANPRKPVPDIPAPRREAAQISASVARSRIVTGATSLLKFASQP